MFDVPLRVFGFELNFSVKRTISILYIFTSDGVKMPHVNGRLGTEHANPFNRIKFQN